MKRKILYCLLKTPQLDNFESASKKALYVTCVKVTNAHLLSGVMSSKWIDFFWNGHLPQR